MSDEQRPMGILVLAPGTDMDKLYEYWLEKYRADNPGWAEIKLLKFGKSFSVTDCNDCPFWGDDAVCKAREGEPPNIVYWGDQMPPIWCPLKDGEITVKLVAKTS